MASLALKFLGFRCLGGAVAGHMMLVLLQQARAEGVAGWRVASGPAYQLNPGEVGSKGFRACVWKLM